jgi:hypothetical protein
MFSASAGLSGGKSSGDCSSCDIAKTMKGISCGSTPRFVRSSGDTGGRPGRGVSSSVNYAHERRVLGLTPWDLGHNHRVNLRAVGGLVGAESRLPSLRAASLI